MLSRTADHLYWMSRYTERAENTARMLDINYQTSLLPQSAEVARYGWQGLLTISELLPLYKEHHDQIVPDEVMEFMVKDESNPSSIFSCLRAARENARAVRSALTTEAWETQNTTWTVTIGDGRYTYVCDAHASQMRGYFLAGAITPIAFTGSVGPKKSISLKPKTALPGPASVTVNDRSKTDNFHLTGPGVNKKTGVKTKGSAVWTVTLRAGTYTYRSDATKKLRRTFKVVKAS